MPTVTEKHFSNTTGNYENLQKFKPFQACCHVDKRDECCWCWESSPENMPSCFCCRKQLLEHAEQRCS